MEFVILHGLASEGGHDNMAISRMTGMGQGAMIFGDLNEIATGLLSSFPSATNEPCERSSRDYEIPIGACERSNCFYMSDCRFAAIAAPSATLPDLKAAEF